MQLFALDENEIPISAIRAVKQRDYTCVECRGTVRLRSGIHRRKHFFHVNAAPSCRLNGKSLVHLQTQCVLQSRLPKEECQLEVPFPSIKRIADVVWESKKIVFEIQCSPITREEVLLRNKDYLGAGYQVVWIFHDRRFNRKRMTGAELALRENSPFYFTDIDQEGKGIIYDQLDSVKKGFRSWTGDPFPIRISAPFSISRSLVGQNKEVPGVIKKRLANWLVAFEGDLVHALCAERSAGFLRKAWEVEQRICPQARGMEKIKQLFEAWVIRPYRIIFQMLLEKASR